MKKRAFLQFSWSIELKIVPLHEFWGQHTRLLRIAPLSIFHPLNNYSYKNKFIV